MSKTLAQNSYVSITFFSFDKSEEISTRAAGGDAFVTCLDGVGKITVDRVDGYLHEGESIVLPANHPPRRCRRGAVQNAARGGLLTNKRNHSAGIFAKMRQKSLLTSDYIGCIMH